MSIISWILLVIILLLLYPAYMGIKMIVLANKLISIDHHGVAAVLQELKDVYASNDKRMQDVTNYIEKCKQKYPNARL